MKVILQKPVDKLGVPGDIVEVADGYGRNFLVPRGLAAAATKGALKHTESLRRAHELRVAKAMAEAEAQVQRLMAKPVRVTARAGEEGKLFGSITGADLAYEIEQQTGERIERRDVHLEDPIRSLGVHEVQVRVHPDVAVTLSIEVVAEP